MKRPDEVSTLSVLLVTYNHARDVGRALDALFGQEFPGPIELVVADDASTDATLETIRAWEGRDARFVFKYLAESANLGITRNYQRGFAACSGDYVAVLEGDDYWISPRKLARQSAFLDQHWECDLCSVNYFVLLEASAEFSARSPIGTSHRFLSARDLIADNLVGNFSTCMYRKTALDGLPPALFDLRSYDWIVNICIASRSLIGFLEEPMSVYRVHSSGAWSSHDQVQKLELQQSLLPAYDQLTEHRFAAEFKQLDHALGHSITMARVQRLARDMAPPNVSNMVRMLDLLPPILVWTLRALVPPALARLLGKFLHRGGGA